MMHQPATGDLGRAFRHSTGAATYQRILMRRQEEEQLRRERKHDDRNDDAELLDFAVVMITASEAAQFKIELDRYDTATITALQENQHAIGQVRERMDHLLGQAHVLPDGRRVFKTESGLRVFDEHGNEVDAATIDPDLIADFRPRWETFKPELDQMNELMAQRIELLAYQQKLDEARERLDAGDLTRDEFDALRDDLKTTMPEAVRAQIPELADEQEPAHEGTEPQAATLDFADDTRPNRLASSAPAPGTTR